MRPLFATLLAALLALAAPAAAQAPAPAPDACAAVPGGKPDCNVWLEDVNGARSMAWVQAHNARAIGVLEGDPNYPTLYAQALSIAQARDRIPAPRFVGRELYNFWQDPDHVRGEWRTTTPAGYALAAPPWRTVIDLDALAKAEGADWVWKGADCEYVHDRLCLVNLSAGGEDAVTVREFDLRTDQFVASGFALSKSKQDVAWVDENALLIARDWGPGTLTASGYAFVVKRLDRGRPLSAATEVFRGQPSDVRVSPIVLHDAQGHSVSLIDRGVSFFESELYLLTPTGPKRLALPAKATIEGLVDGRLIVTVRQDWTPRPGASTIKAGAVTALDLAEAERTPDALRPTVVWSPGPKESLGGIDISRDRMALTLYDNVRGRAYAYAPVEGGGWTRAPLKLPDDSSISAVTASDKDDAAYLGVTGFLTPNTLWRADLASGALAQVKALPPKFDASRDAVDQYEATSKDGTRVPYFVVHPRGMKLDGSNPTLLYAYGGFEVSQTPTYSGGTGKLWLERGGVYVLANIRGGGEFGPAWHEAGLKTHRQVIYDDFAAVAQDVIARGITSPRRLGIRGGSNGGLLMGVEFEQHPELWHAVVIDVPLLDMLRFEQIAAGASWVGEYGSVANPDERAFLAGISPYQNLRAGVAYPEPFIFTTTKDDRVGPVHARKFAARMEQMGLPYLYFENTAGGHSAGANLREAAHTQALEMTYLIRKLMN